MRKLNKNKGITLIALVISIIVMLILVAVSISMAVNGGLFNYAGKAVGDTQNEIDKEKELAEGRIKIGDKWYDSIDDYLNNKPSANQGDGTTSGEGGKIEIPEGLKVGDYVNYTPTTGTYKVADGENGSGYTTDAGYQEFTTETGKNALQWRVWSIDKEKGTVELISATAAQTSGLYLQGADGYNHGVDILNDLCKALYSNTNGATARSINVDDINAKTEYEYTKYTNSSYGFTYGDKIRLSEKYVTSCMKYPNLYSQEKGDGTANAFLQSLGESTGKNDGVTNENKVTSYSTVKGYTDGNTAGTDPYVTYTYYYYKPESNLKTDQGVNTVPTGLINLGNSYWLASRCEYANVNYAYFGVRIVYSDGYVDRKYTFSSNGVENIGTCACRPVVSLNSNVSLTVDESKTNESVTYWNIEY